MCLTQLADAQDPQPKASLHPVMIEVDSITGSAKTSIPFDEPFILKVRMDRIPDIAFVLTTKGRKSGVQLLKEEVGALDRSMDCVQLKADLATAKAKVKSEMDLAQTYRTAAVGVVDPNKLGQLYTEVEKHLKLAGEIQEKEVDPLQERAFAIRCQLKLATIEADRMKLVDEGGRKFLLITFQREEHLVPPSMGVSVIITEPLPDGFTVMELWHAGDIDKAVDLAHRLWLQEQAKLNHRFSAPPIAELAKIYSAVQADMNGITAANNAITAEVAKLRWAELQAELIELERYALLDTLGSTQGCLEDCELLKSVEALRSLSNEGLRSLVEGWRTFEDAKNIEPLAARIGALKDTRGKILRMVRYQAAMRLLRSGTVPVDLPELLVRIDQVLVQLGKINDSRTKVTTLMRGYFLKLSSVVGTTAIYDFNTRSAFRAIPDFGLITYGIPGDYSRITPYLGVQFNIRQSKKNIPWKFYPNKTWLHHLSVSLGYTMSKVAEEGKREDFFEKGSLLTGVGWRFTDELRLTAGGVWFYQNSPNPALQERTLVASPFIGLSVDLDFAKYFNNLQTLTVK